MIREGRGQAILAYFKDPADAERAAEQIKQELNVSDVQIDRFSEAPRGELTPRVINPIQVQFPSHITLIEGSEPSSKSAGILQGTDPAVSGMADGPDQMRLSGRDIILTVVCPVDKVEQAIKIINACGGQH